MKIKLISAFFILTATCMFAQSNKISLDSEKQKTSYNKNFSVSPKTGVSFEKDKIIIAPKYEDVEYVLTGYFNGQIVNRTKGTILKLKNAYIENSKGEPAILCEAKTEISSTKDTKNWIVSTGTVEAKNGAVQSKKKLVFGGSGEMYVIGNVYHAVKGDDVKLKGSGDFYFEGTAKGSGINCSTFTVELEKSFKAYFLNSKNGIKADSTISIASGNFYLSDLETGMKTDTTSENPSKPHGISISGGLIRYARLTDVFKTDQNALKTNGGKIQQM